MSTSNWMSEFWQTFRQLSAAIQRIFRFMIGNWKHSIAGLAAAAALVGEVYIVAQANEEGKVVCYEVNDGSTEQGHHSYFFWLALGIVVACASNLVIAGLATFKNLYLKTNREKNTRWLWPLFAAYVCMMGLMAGILPAALRPNDGPSLFAIISILAIYSQSVLWAIIMGWRDVEKAFKGPSTTPPAPPPPPMTVTAEPPIVAPPQQPPAKFLPLL
ncbi:hypothetical protein INS49_012546 [Diaporthe citri]|uniref:uncharacterized protein n=1 Tax=Diaporthe citri TaxID=83186 RepID=UPI001C7E32E7|nr:uncharacterized protein INS49_012546 [Diaporthe citri]KAG6359026.1 hypothetical protein INS49_012546 [Diaporthe citri]